MKKFTVGVDVGGTNIKLGLVDASGRIIARSRLNTKGFIRNKSKFVNATVDAIRSLITDHKVQERHVLGIGLGLPGLIDPVRGVVTFMPNILGWKKMPLKSLIQKQLRIPTYIENDVNLIALGEWKRGAGYGYKNLLCMTLGTGVGGGLILNNALYRGEGFAAGELGHMPLNERGPECPCGGYACFERYVGNQILLNKAMKIFKNKNIQLEDVYDLAAQGNVCAIQFWEEAAVHIGNALVGVINLLNLRLIIIGGGVSNNFKFLRSSINKVIRQRAMKVQKDMVKVVRAKLGDDAGILGAHVLIEDAVIGRKI